MYYLETNSIRILSKNIYTPYYLKNCYTSILTICELLAGIKDENSFKQRKAIIRIVYFSKILTDSKFPETKRYAAYGIPIITKINESIMLIGGLCIGCRTYSEFESEIVKNDLSESWEFLYKYDNVDVTFKNSYIKRQDAFDYSDKRMIDEFKNKWDTLKDDPELKKAILSDLIAYYAKPLLNNSIINIGTISLQDLVSNYDHSIDIFFLCTGYFTSSKLIYKNAPGRNDYLDLCHLMYLRNPDDVIVTNDNLIIQMMRKISPDNIMTIYDFQKLY